MTRRFLTRSLAKTMQRNLKAMTRMGRKVLKQAASMRAAPRKRGPSHANWSAGVAIGPAGARRYYVYTPPGVQRAERLPLMVMLHGCDQDAKSFAASTGMNRIAARERFIVLYPEQNRLSNMQACWNWYDTRSGQAQSEAATLFAVIDQVCLTRPVDRSHVAIAGFSAGASMAALVASRYPAHFVAIAMHSGVGTGVANSSASAFSAMRGIDASLASFADAVLTPLPALLVIQGSRDDTVAAINGGRASWRWAASGKGLAGSPHSVQRGARYPAMITDWRVGKRNVVTLCEVKGLGHAWSGGTAQNYSDPKGPDAAKMIWAFVARHCIVPGPSGEVRRALGAESTPALAV